MNNLLQDRTPRERNLIYIMLVLCLLFAIWLLVYTPILNAKTQAQSQQENALRNHQIVKSGVGYLGADKSQVKKGLDQISFVQEARNAGLSLARIQPEPGGALRIWSEATSTAQLYTLLETLSDSYALEITRIQIDQRDGALVDVQMTLSPGS